ncbi:MAG TPA: AraC family transcriptional regulator [Cyclobacteriaceae bacterium]|nr:AraC family transcriptional regulator [Cyclobacteriaceae bacterium]
MATENTNKSIADILFTDADIKLSTLYNSEDEPKRISSQINKKLIHFYFCIEGSARFEFSPHYSREIQKAKNYFFYNPEQDLNFTLAIVPKTKMVLLQISLEKLHLLFTHESLPFLKDESANRAFYDEREIPGGLILVLNQLFNIQLSENALHLFYQGKVYEILSLYFSERKPDTASCPFLNDEETVRKIKNVKDFILQHMDNTPGLKELARIHGLNEFQLKVGFKEIYGNTVFGYLIDHKIEHARILLDSGKFKVNEVAYQIGYTNPSHFIAAFRKKFGITPKKYLMQKVNA